MAIATSIFSDPGSSLMTLLRDGVGALAQGINNAVQLGRDRNTTQLNQENTFFRVLDNERNYGLRIAELGRNIFESDRLFGRTLGRDKVADAQDKRNFDQRVMESNRDFNFRKEATAASQNLAERRFAADAASNATTAAQRAQELELRGIETNLRLMGLAEDRAERNELREQNRLLKDRALGSTTSDILANPDQVATLPESDLSGYVDIFGSSRDPEVVGRVNTAKRELARRSPDVDPETGKVIPRRFAADRDNPYLGKTPEEAAIITKNLQDQLVGIEDLIKKAQTGSSRPNTALSTLINTRLELIDKLNKGGISASAPTVPGVDSDAGPAAFFPPKK